MPEDLGQVLELLERAIGLSPAARSELLESECASNPNLRHEVESLLLAHDSAEGFLSTPTLHSQFAPTPNARTTIPESRVGRYKLLDLIGEGGFGSVFLAEQESPVRRNVALKIIKLGMDTRQVVARFEAERQALAMMDHPNIARVFDGGSTDAGRPFFVMELVRGVPITRYCDEQRLTVHQRIELFLPVCQAIQHAHQKGIIHRDIKPTNVLVSELDGKPVAKVIDFGIAKAMQSSLAELTLVTELQQMIGTPAYMSPEQATHDRADVDTRSDIYSLGVLLYELLTGTTPIDSQSLRGTSLDHVQRTIRDFTLVAPSTRLNASAEAIALAAERRGSDPRQLVRAVRGELDWIVMRCLEKEPSRRYESAGALEADLLRHLHGEAVLASPPSRAYRIRKFAARNRVLLIATSIVTVALIGGLITAVVSLQIARRDRDRATTANRVSQRVNRFLNDMLGSADPTVFRGGDVTVKEVLDRASAKVGTELADQPEIEAAVRQTIGETYQGLGRSNLSEPHLQRAYDLSLRKNGPDSEQTLALAATLGEVYADSPGRPDTRQFIRDSLARSQGVHGADHDATLQLMNTLGMMCVVDRNFSEAEQILRSAIALLNGRSRQPDHLYITLRQNLGVCFNQQRRSEEAIFWSREALVRSRAVYGPDARLTIQATASIAANLLDANRPEESLEIYRESLRIAQQQLGDENPITVENRYYLAYNLETLRRSAEAEPLLQQSLDYATRMYGADHPQTLVMMSIMSRIKRSLKKYDEAEQLSRKIFAVRQVRLGDDHPDTISVAYNLAEQLEGEGRFADALPFAKVAYGAAVQGTNSDLAQRSAGIYGQVLLGVKRPNDAEAPLRRAYELRQQSGQTKTKSYRRLLEALVEMCDQTGGPDEAAEWRARLAALPPVATSRSTTAP